MGTATQTYVDYGAGSDSTGDGSISTPWKTLQYAFDHLTRNTSDGNQVNLKAGTAQVNSAALDLTTFIAGGALALAAPLIVRGYTSAANDGGIGEIDCGGATMWATTTYDYIHLIDLKIHTFGDNDGIVLDTNWNMLHCEVYKGASSPSGKSLVKATTQGGDVYGCYIHDPGTGAAKGINTASATGNYVVMEAGSTGDYGLYGVSGSGNIVVVKSTSSYGAYCNGALTGNIFYNTAAGTGNGIYSSTSYLKAYNNIFVGWSGAGGDGIAAVNPGLLGYNAFYNCTNTNTVSDQIMMNLTANDVSLAADPFTNAAGGDFSLTAAAKTALAGKGFPIAYYGAHANSTSNLLIGAIQLAATTCSYPAVGDVEDGVSYGGGSYTGTFGVPSEAEVEDGVGYGAGGTEFTGTLVVGAADWTSDEKEQIRQALGVTGDTAPTSGTGNLDAVLTDTGTTLPAEFAALATDEDIADAVLGEAVEGSYTLQQLLQLLAAVFLGKASGGGTTTVTFRNIGDTTNAVVATVDSNGNRSSVTLTLPA